MNHKKSSEQNFHENTNELNLNQLSIPIHLAHVKSGSTLCSSDNVILMQDGSTTIEFRLSPEFQVKRLPWRFGLIRDIVWCADLDLFILLTRDAAYSISPKSLFIEKRALNKPLPDFTVNTYSKLKPDNDRNSFWRCTCVGTTLYIVYSGYGTVIDEYTIGISSCKFITRWTPPKTCAIHEGIWCICYHPEIDQLGFTIMDARNDQWRIEIRSRNQLTLLWQMALPISNGDCEISPLPNGEWLAINTCGIRLIQITNQKIKAAVEYERELKNAVAINHSYLAIRTKNTLEIHKIKQSK